MLKLTTIIATTSLVVTDNEPQCYSRFDYEYKVVQKLVELENSQRQQLEIYKVLQTEFENFKSQLAAVESVNKNLRADFSKVKDRNNYLDTELQNIKNRSRQTEGNDLFHLKFKLSDHVTYTQELTSSGEIFVDFYC